MQPLKDLPSSIPPPHDEPRESLREVAAYLRGIADAAAALGEPTDPATSASPPSFHPSDRRSRNTMPYGITSLTIIPVCVPPKAYPTTLPAPEGLLSSAPARASWLDANSWNDPWEEGERPSAVRLKVSALPAEWYTLAEARSR